MGRSEPSFAVADAGPIIHLDELACLDLLEGLGQILMPSTVWDEVLRHRPSLAFTDPVDVAVVKTTPTPSSRLLALADLLGLHAGERASLALLEQRPTLFLCDDAAARLAAESLGFTVHNILTDLPAKSSLHVSRSLLATVLSRLSADA